MHFYCCYKPTSEPKTSAQQQGFTLIELILVIVLLAIVSAIALPRFFDRNEFDQRVFFDDTLNAIRYAQKVAVATGCHTQITISANSYALLREDNCDGSSPTFNNSLVVVDPVTGYTEYIGSQSGVNISATQTVMSFDALGRIAPSASSVDNTISVGSRQITVTAATGFSYDSTP